MNVLSLLAPVVSLALLGVLLRRSGALRAEEVRGLNRLNYLAALPALLFLKVSGFEGTLRSAAETAGVVVATALLVVLLSALSLRLRKRPTSARAAFVQGAYRGNLAFIGAPLAVQLASQQSAVPAACGDEALVTLGMAVPCYNVIAVLLLAGGQGQGRLELGLRVLRNPLFLGGVGGALFRLIGAPMPPLLHQSLELVGQAAVPLGLVAVGAALELRGLSERLIPALRASGWKLAVSPALAWLMVQGLAGSSACTAANAVVFAATPTAVASYIMAEQMGADAKLAADIVAVSSLAGLLTLPLWL